MERVSLHNVKGLSESEARKRLEGGYNELPHSGRRNLLKILAEVFKEPMFLLLVSGGLIYMFLGDLQEALMLMTFVVVVVGITVYQERKVERALEALQDLSSPRALVVRDGKPRRVPGREIVVGDVIILSEGDRVPADGRLLFASGLQIDESLLTGESVPVTKSIWEKGEIIQPSGDSQPFAYSGSLVVDGYGLMECVGTGVNTEIGKVGKALQILETEDTPLQRESRSFVKKLSIAGLAVCTFVVLVIGFSQGEWTQGLLSGIALAMAILPEEIPVVLTIFLALGAWRMSKSNVLTRRLQAIQALGSATVLCVDKTGTLTLNRMAVKRLFTQDGTLDIGNQMRKLPEKFHKLLEFGILACRINSIEPMEIALKELGESALSGTRHIHENWDIVRDYNLSPELMATSYVWRSPGKKEYVVAAKGAPEAVASLCHLSRTRRKKILSAVHEMADSGLRVLGVAASYAKGNLPKNQHAFKFRFLGLVGFSDPVRDKVPSAVAEAHGAGVRVIMMTGDYPATARNIAHQVGIACPESVITGPELADMSDADLRDKIKEVNVFARMVPEQKMRLVNALKANGEIVAMTGDGVNDAPALKAAHIGIAMGGRGAEVAREASSMVLVDDDFSSIVRGVRLGRRIFDNLQKAVSYILAVHLPILGISVLPLLLGWPAVLLPAHIAFLELIIDPACSIVFEVEPEEPDNMKHPPRGLREPMFDRKTVVSGVIQGTAMLGAILAVFSAMTLLKIFENRIRSIVFTMLVVTNMCLIISNLSKSSLKSAIMNKALPWVLVGATGALSAILYVPTLSKLFHFAPLTIAELIFCVAFGAGCLIVLEFLKIFLYKRPNHSSSSLFKTS
ncbi:cation-translocating P-type ATPase [Candidatus Bathyarchaeota archaeon]|nr:cation-translocating P-type ATPase [Candidatus Bathyarchaeota archaeon]